MGDQLDLVVPKKKAVAKKEDKPVSFESLIKLAMGKENGIEIIKELSKLQNQQEDRLCKKEFDFHFAEMQKELEPIERTKKGYQFMYADLPMMERKYRPIISKHGFSYKWTTEQTENDMIIRIHISGHGHTDSNSFFSVPPLEKTASQNSIQAEGARVEYGRRQSFKLGFGVSEIGEDTDGDFSFNDGIVYANEILSIRACKNKEQLTELWKSIYKNLSDNKERDGLKILTFEKDKKKKEFK